MNFRGDFHMHTYFSYDCLVSPEALVKRCETVNLNCIAVTDHNSIEGAKAVKKIAPFHVIIGAEIKSTEGEITGLFLEEIIPAGLSPIETIKRIKEQNGIVSVPHPFTGGGRSALSKPIAIEILPYVDLIEGFNARTMNSADNMKAKEFAQEHKLPMTAVSDAHTTRELGATYTEFSGFDGSKESFIAAISDANRVEVEAGKFVHVYTTLNKQIHRFKKYS